jgi:hypothetical protein
VVSGVRVTREEKSEVNPGEIARALLDVVQLGLLSGPEDPQREKAHAVYDPLRSQRGKGLDEFVLGVDLRSCGGVQVEHQQGHGYREDAVAQCGKAIEISALDPVVESEHAVRPSFGSYTRGWLGLRIRRQTPRAIAMSPNPYASQAF